MHAACPTDLSPLYLVRLTVLNRIIKLAMSWWAGHVVFMERRQHMPVYEEASWKTKQMKGLLKLM
jgi:hypothetical protein